jgi:hypothetical protein
MSTPEENGEGGESRETEGDGAEKPEPTDIKARHRNNRKALTNPRSMTTKRTTLKNPRKEEDGEPILRAP